VGFGLLNRLVPNIQVFFVTVPITLWLGIFILGLSLGGMLSLYAEELAAYGLIFMQE
jgi:flagellar biosynthetic protein FliR